LSLWKKVSKNTWPRHPLPKRSEELSPRQYKNLRKLIILWFKTLLHHRIKMVMYFSLLTSLSVNAFFYQRFITIKNEEKATIDKVYNLYNLDTIYGYEQTSIPLKQRIHMVYDGYIKDHASPDYSYYKDDRVTLAAGWHTHCFFQLRRITSLQARVKDIENVIYSINNDGDFQDGELDKMIRDKKFEDVLSEMSNYYARFITQEDYKSIVETVD